MQISAIRFQSRPTQPRFQSASPRIKSPGEMSDELQTAVNNLVDVLTTKPISRRNIRQSTHAVLKQLLSDIHTVAVRQTKETKQLVKMESLISPFVYSAKECGLRFKLSEARNGINQVDISLMKDGELRREVKVIVRGEKIRIEHIRNSFDLSKWFTNTFLAGEKLVEDAFKALNS